MPAVTRHSLSPEISPLLQNRARRFVPPSWRRHELGKPPSRRRTNWDNGRLVRCRSRTWTVHGTGETPVLPVKAPRASTNWDTPVRNGSAMRGVTVPLAARTRHTLTWAEPPRWNSRYALPPSLSVTELMDPVLKPAIAVFIFWISKLPPSSAIERRRV